jgi:hypothetical protein
MLGRELRHMVEGLKLRDNWVSKIVRTATWSPLFYETGLTPSPTG